MPSTVAPSPVVSLRCYGAVSACDVHAFHQIVLGLDGAMEMIVDGVGQRVDARHAWLIPAGARHDYTGIGVNRQLVLDVPPASLAVPERLFSRPLAVTLDDALLWLVRDVAAGTAGMAGTAYAMRATNSAASPLSTLNENDAHETLDVRDAPWTRRVGWEAAVRLASALFEGMNVEVPATGLDFARIDKWLRAHLSESLRMGDLAAHCGFGMRRFHQLFDEAFGTTPHRYLQRLRLDAALVMLRDPRNTLTDIALTVGFGDQSAFTHAFTRRFGLAPGQWRAARSH